MRRRTTIAAAAWGLVFVVCLCTACAVEPEKKESEPGPVRYLDDAPFYQEIREEHLRADVEGYLTGVPQEANRIYAVAAGADENAQVYAGGESGLQVFSGNQWRELAPNRIIYCLLPVDDGLYAGSDGAVVVVENDEVSTVELSAIGRVRALEIFNDALYAGGDHGVYVYRGDSFAVFDSVPDCIVYDLLADEANGLWIATENGLYLHHDDGIYHWTTDDYLVSNNLRGLALDETWQLWIAATAGLNLLRNDGVMVSYTGHQGMPIIRSAAVAIADNEPETGVWIGTDHGLLRLRNGQWNYYAGRRWLPDDTVNDVAVDAYGNIWAATDNGLSRLRFQQWTLQKKAEHYLELNRTRHDRYGLVASCTLDLPGDLRTFRPRDSSNDGLWTGMYLAALSFQYAVTGNAEIKQLADEHFAAMAFLEAVTGVPGLPARSIDELYSHSQDPECYPLCQWRANEELGFDWKSDTSSDEITGHFYAYAIYYDLVADGEQRQQVIELVWRMANHLVENQFFLIDWDGEPTTWGVWNPEFLWEWYKLSDIEAQARYAGLIYVNSLEILSFMRTAYHITGDTKFLDAYNQLIDRHALDDLMLNAEIYFPMVTNHSAEELMFLAYYPLLRYEDDPALHSRYLDSLRRSWSYNRIEQSSLFNITYGALADEHDDLDLPAAIDNLQQIPLDLVDWRMENSHRLDVVFDPLPNRLGETISATDRPPLPPDERPMMKWNGDPFTLDGGGPGTEEEAGTFWLLPYWMGRYHGFIGE